MFVYFFGNRLTSNNIDPVWGHVNHLWLSNHLQDSEIHLYIDQSNKNFSVYSVFKSSRFCRFVIEWSIENMSDCTRCHYVGVSVRLTTDPTNIVFQLYRQKWTIVLNRTFDNLSMEKWTFDWINLVKSVRILIKSILIQTASVILQIYLL